jgi:hypothetical protein
VSGWRGWFGIMLIAALPASNNYSLNSYGFGSGGAGNATSSNYAVNGITGETSGDAASANYQVRAGETHVKEAHVPTATLVNSDNWYNKLLLTIGPENNPSDATFAVAISTDNFATVTRYVKSDFTIGTTLTTSDYLTYAAWGSGAGVLVRGLERSTVYTVKVKAYRGKFTESQYGPIATAATVDPQLTFDIDVAATDISTSPPYQIDFGALPVSTVTDSPKRVWVTFETNAESGGKVYVSAQNTGLRSLLAAYTIGSQTGDLSSLAEGFGAQGTSATQSSGGPLAIVAPYDGTAANVGVTDPSIRDIFTTAAPVTAGRASFILKAKTQPLTPAQADYTEILTAIAAASF